MLRDKTRDLSAGGNGMCVVSHAFSCGYVVEKRQGWGGQVSGHLVASNKTTNPVGLSEGGRGELSDWSRGRIWRLQARLAQQLTLWL